MGIKHLECRYIANFHISICKRITIEESHEPTDEDEAMMKLLDNVETLVNALAGDKVSEEDLELPSSVFPLDKSKLH